MVFEHLLVIADDIVFFDVDTVSLVMAEVKEDSTSASCTSDTGIHPDQFRVFGHRDQGEPKDGSKAVGEQEEGHDDRLHRLRCLLVGVLKTSDGRKDFRDGDKHIGRDLISSRDPVLAVTFRGFTWVFVVRRTPVDHGLDASRVAPNNTQQLVSYAFFSYAKERESDLHGDSSKEETKRDTQDRAHVDTETAKTRVHDAIHQRNDNDQGDGVNVLHDIVRHIAG